MAAVFCFVFLFGLAACALLAKVFFTGSLVSAVAGTIFIALAVGVFIAAFKLAKGWESEAGPEH
ncbi:MAG TPA: hypothetical protein VMJ10_20190 [Kofleriaceae bacterium]|nr:hypothetical protein [Kofleriaceae bacterium]